MLADPTVAQPLLPIIDKHRHRGYPVAQVRHRVVDGRVRTRDKRELLFDHRCLQKKCLHFWMPNTLVILRRHGNECSRLALQMPVGEGMAFCRVRVQPNRFCDHFAIRGDTPSLAPQCTAIE